MKFFIIGGYAFGNPGDEAILKSTVYAIHENFPKSFFYIWNENSDFTVQFDRPIRHRMVFWEFPQWMHLDNFMSRVIVKLYTDLFPFSKKLTMALHRPPPSLIRAMRDSDKVLFLGGGYINSHYSLHKMNIMASIVQAQNKPLILLGQTLGPFEKPSHVRMASEIFEIAKTIVIRDQHFGEEAVRFKDKIRKSVDDAVSFSPRIEEKTKAAVDSYFQDRGEGVSYWGINLRQWNDSRDYYLKIASGIESFVNSFPHLKIKWLFIPMETTRYCDDRSEGELLAQCLEGRNCDFTVVRENFSVEEKFYFLSRLDLFLGMRLHSLVFSLDAGVPAIGIYHNEYYRRKICGLLQSFGVEECALSLQKSEGLAALIGELFKKKAQLKKMILEKKESLVRGQRLLLRNVLEAEA